MRLVSVVGARPQLVKLAPLCGRLAARGAGADPPIDHRIVHTGQHYDAALSGSFFAELGLPAPALELGAGSGTHARQTARMLDGLEEALTALGPDVVAVYGDTNTTLAGALAAAKLGLPLAHVEAGLRSFDRRTPEEVNRVVADHVADLLLAPTATAMANLAREGLASRAVLSGDLLCDAVVAAGSLDGAAARARLGLAPGAYVLATVHRAENTDDPARLGALLAALATVAATHGVVLPMHPRTARRLRETLPGWRPPATLRIVEPLGHGDLLGLLAGAQLVLTDSGGVQREALFVGCPCVTLRDASEWPETVAAGGNLLAGTTPAGVEAAVAAWAARREDDRAALAAAGIAAFGGGRAAERIVDALVGLARDGGAP